MRIVPLCTALLIAAAPALATAAAPLSGQGKLDRLLAGRTAGEPVSCISLNRSPHSTIIDDRTILYRAGSMLWVNRLPQSCGGMRPGNALVTRTPIARLCSGDIVTVIDPPLPGSYGSCTLADFIPYRKPAK